MSEQEQGGHEWGVRFWAVVCPLGHHFEVPGDEQPAVNFRSAYGQDLPPFPPLGMARCPTCGNWHTGERRARRCIRRELR